MANEAVARQNTITIFQRTMKGYLPDPAAAAVVVVVDVSRHHKQCISVSDSKGMFLENSPTSMYRVIITANGIPAATRPIINPITRVTVICRAHHPACWL